MEGSEIEKFTTDFKELAKFIQCSKDKNALRNLVKNNEKFKHMDPLTANIANDVTHSGLNLTVNREGAVDMCVAIAGIREEGILKGRMEGENRLIALMQRLFSDGREAEIKRVSEDAAYREKLMREFGLK